MASERFPAGRQGWRVFVDTNVLIAGLLSQTGGSACLLDLGDAEEIDLVLTRYVLLEFDRVITEKLPRLSERYDAFLKDFRFELQEDPPISRVREATSLIDPGDAPILAAARMAQVDYLVTLDVRHFHTPRVRAYLPIPILTPAEFLTAFRNFLENL